MPDPTHPTSPHSMRPSLQERLQALNATSSAEATALAQQGKHATIAALVWAPICAFWHAYLGHGEWRHRLAGLISAIFTSYGVFLSYTKLWEQQHVKTTIPPPSHP